MKRWLSTLLAITTLALPLSVLAEGNSTEADADFLLKMAAIYPDEEFFLVPFAILFQAMSDDRLTVAEYGESIGTLYGTLYRMEDLSSSDENLRNAAICINQALGNLAKILYTPVLVNSSITAAERESIYQQMNFTLAAKTLYAPTEEGRGKGFATIPTVDRNNPDWTADLFAEIITRGMQALQDETDEVLARASENINLSADPASVARISASIDVGINAAKKEHRSAVDVLASPDQGQEDIQTQFDTIIADGKVDKAEYTATVRLLDDTVVEEAKDVLKDDPDNTVAQELMAAETEYQALLDALYRSRRTATQDELDALEAALDRVKALRVELKGNKH